nr:unnamed protein product [Callosobruchus chinensis]
MDQKAAVNFAAAGVIEQWWTKR